MKRNPRAGVEDRWTKTIRDVDGTIRTEQSAGYGKGSRWRARYVDDRGKEHAKGFSRKADAQQWLNKQVSNLVTGTWTDPALSGVTFGVMAQRWISTKAARAPKTVAGYRSLLDTVVLPRWEAVSLREIEFDDLQVWISGLSVDGSSRFEGKGLSASRVRQAHQLVGAVLKFAVRAKHLTTNPAEGIELPRLPETEQRYLTHEQLHRVAVAAGRLRTLILVLGYCGLRFGEATALRVADVDVTARRIRIRLSVTHVRKTGLVEGPTKNHTARTVPVPAFVARLLETEIKDRGEAALVFQSARGGHLTIGQARYAFAKAVSAVGGVNQLRLHDLRHTCASLAIREGANVKVVQKLLGHKSAVLTLDKYGHLFPDDLDAVANAFDTAADALRTAAPYGRPTVGTCSP
ncbi:MULTISPECIES: site-specific integrase [Mycobacterium]|uniref:Site-specific integrase n=1 Tax=Mycobacterium colombiense TaxID=339268 RepID=A0A329MAI7_9MYCO|nr:MULTISPECIES: site-specific integrase [Mycobacterium]MDM4138776.1 site-specific integrase [Mycobacterium sp. FLAC0960]RAV14067.1 site-specific integrase [Mycobacterium colombiense]